MHNLINRSVQSHRGTYQSLRWCENIKRMHHLQENSTDYDSSSLFTWYGGKLLNCMQLLNIKYDKSCILRNIKEDDHRSQIATQSIINIKSNHFESFQRNFVFLCANGRSPIPISNIHNIYISIAWYTYHIIAKAIYCIVDKLWSSHVVCDDFLQTFWLQIAAMNEEEQERMFEFKNWSIFSSLSS